MQLQEMRRLMVWRRVLDQQAQVSPSNPSDHFTRLSIQLRTVPYEVLDAVSPELAVTKAAARNKLQSS